MSARHGDTIGALAILVAIGIYYGQYNALNIATVASRLRFGSLDMIALVLLAAFGASLLTFVRRMRPCSTSGRHPRPARQIEGRRRRSPRSVSDPRIGP